MIFLSFFWLIMSKFIFLINNWLLMNILLFFILFNYMLFFFRFLLKFWLFYYLFDFNFSSLFWFFFRFWFLLLFTLFFFFFLRFNFLLYWHWIRTRWSIIFFWSFFLLLLLIIYQTLTCRKIWVCNVFTLFLRVKHSFVFHSSCLILDNIFTLLVILIKTLAFLSNASKVWPHTWHHFWENQLRENNF
jgi:hypothetical protein